jgi:hypothetical protein
MSVYDYIRIDDYSLPIEEVARRLGCSRITEAARACYRDRDHIPCRFYKDSDTFNLWLCGGGKDYGNDCKYKLSELLGELGNW